MTDPPPYESAPPIEQAPPPPQQQAYTEVPIWRPLEGRLLAVKIVFWGIAAIALAAAVSGLFEILLLNRIIAGENVTASQVDANDSRQAIIAVIQFVSVIAGAVVFIMWLRSAYKNVDAVARGQRRYGHGWAIGGWFVPIMAAWRPKQVINDVWRAGGHPVDPPALLAIWWTLWIAGNFLSNVARRVGDGDDPGDIRSGTITYLISDLLFVAAAILAIFVAAKLTERLNARAAEGPPQPTAVWSPEPETERIVMGGTPPPPPLGSR